MNLSLIYDIFYKYYYMITLLLWHHYCYFMNMVLYHNISKLLYCTLFISHIAYTTYHIYLYIFCSVLYPLH